MNAKGETRDERLWCAVILQALEDAVSESAKRDADRQHARQWLTQHNANFDDVCALAGVEPEHVRTFASLHIDKHDRALRRVTKKMRGPRRGPRSGKKYEAHGKRLTIMEWSERLGVGMRSLRSRLAMGWPHERVFTKALVPHGHFGTSYEAHGARLTLIEWSDRLGIKVATLKSRLRYGWLHERVFATRDVASKQQSAPGVDRDFQSDAGDRWGEARAGFAQNRDFSPCQ